VAVNVVLPAAGLTAIPQTRRLDVRDTYRRRKERKNRKKEGKRKEMDEKDGVLGNKFLVTVLRLTDKSV